LIFCFSGFLSATRGDGACAARAVWLFMPSRGGVLLRTLFGLFAFALASA
jgi:hypothetical protein